MPPIQKPMRYAHSDGHTGVCFSDDGKFIISCGNDGEIRVWAGIEDDDNRTICVAEEKANAIAVKGDRVYISTDDNLVQVYTYPEFKRDGIATRFTGPVTNITISPSGNILASGSCDMEIHVVYLNKTSSEISLLGHSAPIIGVAVDPKDKYLISSSCDGTIRLWDLSSKETVKNWDCVPKSNSFSMTKILARASWQPTGNHYLAVPEENEIGLYEYSTWSRVGSLSLDSSAEQFSLTVFSPCGLYLASVSGDKICVWNVTTEKLLHTFTHERGNKTCSMLWNPSKNGEIVYSDIMGLIGTIENVSHEVFSTGTSNEVESRFGEKADIDVEKELGVFKMDDDDDDDGENVISLNKIKNEVSMNFGSDIEDKDDDNEDARSSVSGSNIPSGLKVNAQPFFQPSSSPESLQHRYMVWNSVGIIRCINNESESSIDIRFHDTTIHHAMHLSNNLGHTIATMSRQAVSLACPIAVDEPSKIVCHMLNAWDGSREWMSPLPEGESAVGIAMGDHWLAVATDLNNLRVFGLAGTQRQILSTPGKLVCLVGSKDKLFMVFHAGIGLPNEQNLFYQQLTISPAGPISSSISQPLPITPGSTLKWIGFSDEMSPCTLDSSDMLRLLPSRSNIWMPICNTKESTKGASDHFFVVGVNECSRNVRAILSRGAYYPPTAPLPVMSELSFNLPYCEMDTEKTKLEESFWQAQLTLLGMTSIISTSKDDDDLLTAERYKSESEKTIKETLMKLFALATRSELEIRAIELCHLMPSAHVAELAAKYALKLGRSLLADRISEIVSIKQNAEDSKRFSYRATSPDLFASQTGAMFRLSGKENTEMNGYESNSTQDKLEKEGENLLLAAKRKREALEADKVEIRPSVFPDHERRNPFKRLATSRSDSSGLECLSSPYSTPQELKKLYKNSTDQTSLPTTGSKAKQMTLFGKKASSEDSIKGKKKPFPAWFAENKSKLQEEFPELDNSGLMKTGMKRYKELNAKPKQDTLNRNTDIGVESQEPEKSKTDESQHASNPFGGESEDIFSAVSLPEAEVAMDSEGKKTNSASEVKSGISKLKSFTFKSKNS